MDSQRLKLSNSPVFYRNLFKVWSLFKKNRESNGASLFWLLQEPLVCGSRLDLSREISFFIPERTLCNAKLTAIDHLYQIAGSAFKNVTAIAEHLGLKSCRIVAKALGKWRLALTEEETELLDQYSKRLINPDCKDPFPKLGISPILGEYNSMFLVCKEVMIVGSNVSVGKELYKVCVKAFNKKFLDNKCDTPW